jgi:hypothetical protein
VASIPTTMPTSAQAKIRVPSHWFLASSAPPKRARFNGEATRSLKGPAIHDQHEDCQSKFLTADQGVDPKDESLAPGTLSLREVG